MTPIPRLRALHLYSAPLSGCSARVKTALYHKRIPDTLPVSITDISTSSGQNRSPEYLSLNPNGSVPTLIAELEDEAPAGPRTSPQKLTVTQSPAIISFLEDLFPSPPLVPPPSQPHARARALEIAALVACDIQPPQSSRIRKRIGDEYGGDGEEWARWVYRRGFGVVECLLNDAPKGEGGKGRYCVGDEVTVADVFLVPAVQGALRVGVDVVGSGSEWPLTRRVIERCWELEAFRKGGLVGHGKLRP